MSNFKVGDMVRRINTDNEGVKVGQVGMITEIVDGEYAHLDIGDIGLHNFCNLELAKSSEVILANKFKVGDNIKVIEPFNHDGIKFEVNDKGKICKIDTFNIGISWEKHHEKFHDLDSFLKTKTGWFIGKERWGNLRIDTHYPTK